MILLHLSDFRMKLRQIQNLMNNWITCPALLPVYNLRFTKLLFYQVLQLDW